MALQQGAHDVHAVALRLRTRPAREQISGGLELVWITEVQVQEEAVPADLVQVDQHVVDDFVRVHPVVALEVLEALIEVALGADERIDAVGRGRPAGVLQDLGQGHELLRQVTRIGVLHAVPRRGQARHQGSGRGPGPGRGREGALVGKAVGGHSIEARSQTRNAPDPVGPQSVDHDENHVGVLAVGPQAWPLMPLHDVQAREGARDGSAALDRDGAQAQLAAGAERKLLSPPTRPPRP